MVGINELLQMVDGVSFRGVRIPCRQCSAWIINCDLHLMLKLFAAECEGAPLKEHLQKKKSNI